MMKDFGVSVTTTGTNGYDVPKAVYSNPSRYKVEADASSASYALTMAAISGGSSDPVEAIQGTISSRGPSGDHATPALGHHHVLFADLMNLAEFGDFWRFQP